MMHKILSLFLTSAFLHFNTFSQSNTRIQTKALQNQSTDPQKPKTIRLFSAGLNDRKDPARNIRLNRNTLAWVWEQEPEQFTTTLPLPHDEVETLTFVKRQVSTGTCVISTSDGRSFTGKEFIGLHYQIDQSKGRRVGGISFREDGVMGVISHKSGSYNLGEQTPGRGDYVVVNDAELIHPGWTCGAEDGPVSPEKGTLPVLEEDKVSASCKTIKMFLEVDFDMYKKAGQNVSTATNMLTGLFNIVSQMYLNEQITMQVGTIFVWTTTDPYALLTSSSTVLSTYYATRLVSSIGTNNLAHLVSTRSSFLGGIGYLNVLCNTYFRHAFSNIYYSYSALPTYSWSVHCITHEIGHNLGSKHTHWCGWQLTPTTTGPIDRCYTPEGSCGTTTTSQAGTVMSYCHLNGTIDLNLGFGTLPGATIRNGLNNAICISGSGCLGTASVSVDSTSNKDKNFALTITAPANHNAASWSLKEGTTTIQSGTFANQNAFSIQIPITNKSNGSYSYSVTLANSGGQTTISNSTIVTVAVPVASIGSSCIADGLMAWIDATGKLRFRFNLSPACTTYAVALCRYNLTNPAVQPSGTELPTACSVRNGMSAYTPTANERAQGYIERVASPQPSNLIGQVTGSYWYSCDVTCGSSNCMTTNRTRTYIFIAQP